MVVASKMFSNQMLLIILIFLPASVAPGHTNDSAIKQYYYFTQYWEQIIWEINFLSIIIEI